jgi:hypothetical protein
MAKETTPKEDGKKKGSKVKSHVQAGLKITEIKPM